MDPPRSAEQRVADAVSMLTAPGADAWVASASSSGAPHLVPLSIAWDGERLILATEQAALTTRNIVSSTRARLGLGRSRDVVMVDALLDRATPVAEAQVELAEQYAQQADWDPRSAASDFVYLLLRPTRIQVWREVNEIADRTVLRNGAWIA